MTSSNSQDRKKLSLSSRGKLSLGKTVETGQVKQSFSHGRSKTVQVEVKRKRVAPTPNVPSDTGASKVSLRGQAEAAPEEVAAPAPQPAAPAAVDQSGGTLTADEREARMRALEEGLKQQEAEQEVEEQEAAAAADAEKAAEVEEPVEIDRRQAELLEAQNIANDEAAKAEKEAARLAEEDAARQARAAAERAASRLEETGDRGGAHTEARPSTQTAEENERSNRKREQVAPKRTNAGARRGDQRRRSGKLTISQALDDRGGERVRSLAAVKRARAKEKARMMGEDAEAVKQVREVTIPDVITVQELSNRMAERGADVVKSLMKLGIMATITETIDADTAELVAQDLGHKVKRVSESDVEIGLIDSGSDDGNQLPRAPVVTVMGHVDHGKTSLLDALRKTDVAAGEAGGITQHIGAYQVEVSAGNKITFLDTPGHAAFTEMRARGADVTDIVVLVVAADDGIMEQTIEAIRHAKAAECPTIIAVNKIDKPDADPQRVRTELLQHDIVVEEVGGDVLAVDVSAITGEGLDRLEETILLQAELLELKANPEREGQGAVIEAKMERGRGSVATILVQSGTVSVGDIFVAGAEWGKVRALIDDRGRSIESAGPGMPVEVLGLNGTPLAGDTFNVVGNEARAREITEYRQRQVREKQAVAGARGTVEQMLAQVAAGEAEELPLIIKTDVHGSLEAIRSSLEKLSNSQVAVRILHGAVGGINESDITLAKASGALVIGFNVRANPQARELSSREGIELRYYSIIYNVIDDLKAAMTGMLSPELREEFLGNAEIREVFNITKVGKVAGCMVTEGVVRRGASVRLLRDNVVIHEGSLKTLKRFKEEVREVREGFECGSAFENYNDIQVGDFIECFEVKEIARTLESVQ